MGRPAPVPESCTTGAWPGLADAVPVTPVPKPRGPPTVSMLQRAEYCPTPPRTTQLFEASQAIPKRGIAMVFVWKDFVRAPFRPANQIEPLGLTVIVGVLGTGLGTVGSNPPILFLTSLI